MDKFVCIDIGGTSIKYSIIDESGLIITKSAMDTEAYLGGLSIMEKAKRIVSNYQKDYEIDGICISTAGMVDKDGNISFANELIPNYTGTAVKKIMEDEFNLPCEVENDVNCAGLSEAIVGSAKGSKISVCLTIGTGIGGCMIVDNQIFHGSNYTAFEVGYINTKNGILQDEASTNALVKRVSEKKKIDKLNGKIIFEEAKKGDKICIDEIDYLVDTLGNGIANICYIVNPEVVVLGGGIMAQKNYLEEKIKASVKKYLKENIYNHTDIKFAKNDNDAGMLGAYYNFKLKR